jgi:hypothetical protein
MRVARLRVPDHPTKRPAVSEDRDLAHTIGDARKRLLNEPANCSEQSDISANIVLGEE